LCHEITSNIFILYRMGNIGDIINGNLFLYELHWIEPYKMEIGIICPVF
jgi:hypothetical protein